jgi:hypothetical protein
MNLLFPKADGKLSVVLLLSTVGAVVAETETRSSGVSSSLIKTQ